MFEIKSDTETRLSWPTEHVVEKEIAKGSEREREMWRQREREKSGVKGSEEE